jgi:hypothetical protein
VGNDEHPKTFREVGIMLSDIRDDISSVVDSVREIKAGQQKVIWWVGGMVSSLVVGGVLGWVFQK